MKMNLKAWMGALCVLFASSTASALDAPVFSTIEAPHWYQIKFTTGGHVLKDNGANQNLVTADPGTDNAQKWQLIGSADNFKLASKSGRYVGFSNGRFNAVAGEASAVSLKIKDLGSDWEIARVGQSNAMNQWGGTGVGVQLGEYNSADPNNKLQFISLSAIMPTFSTADATTWYFIQFAQNGSVITSNGLGNKATRPTVITPSSSKLWKLVGDGENFQIVNKNGEYLSVSGSGGSARLIAADSPYSAGFSLVESPSTAHAGTWEIVANGISGSNKRLNLWEGAGSAAQEIGFYAGSAGETGNALRFKKENEVAFGEFEFIGSETFRPEQKLSLWYTRPATTASTVHQWMDLGLPIGNGQLGAMVLGGIKKEDISVNEKTLWTGDTELRGSYSYGCYQNFGSLYVTSREEGIGFETPVRNYWRDLDLTTGVARVHYENADGVAYDRKYIASNPDNVVAALFTASKPGALSLNFEEVPGMARDHEVAYSVEGNVATIEYHGKFEIISYCSVIKIIPSGENATIALAENGKSVDIKNADSAYVVIAAGTDYDPVAPTYTSETAALNSNMEAVASNALTKGWDAVLADHVPDHQKFFGRVEFDLEGSANDMPTDQMRSHYSSATSRGINVDDPAVKMIEMLYFHYGRYLEIGSSRGVDLPGNLQGIWSGYNVHVPHAGGQIAPWNCDIHTNINVQMCYWPCEPTNLSELHLPFLNYIINQATVQPQWRNFAKNVTKPAATDPDAWTCAVENNIFGGMGSYDTKYSVANAWYCTHLWQHYAYTLDKEFLERALPTMWGATKFWLDRMILANDGTYECPSESSPEHGPNQNGVAHAQQIVAELFANMLAAVEALPDQTIVDAEGLARLNDRYAKMDKGIAIEQYTGAWGAVSNGIKTGDDLLREWKYADYSKGQNGHRHISHLMCLYPYSQLTPGTREYNAAVNSLRQRGDDATGWSIGWKVNLWARAQDGDHARQILRNGISNQAYNNLFDSHAPFQIDGNFGCTTGVAEMFVQSLGNTVWVMPALPSLWADGEMTGLKAAGDFTVDLKWADNHLTLATITANQGGTLSLGNLELVNTRLAVNGTAVTPEIVKDYATGNITTVIAGLNPGDKVTMVYDADYTQPNVKEEESKIDSIVVGGNAGSIDVSVSNGTVIASGAEIADIKVYDLAGRQIAASSASTCKVNAAGQVVLVKVTAATGEVKTIKSAI